MAVSLPTLSEQDLTTLLRMESVDQRKDYLSQHDNELRWLLHAIDQLGEEWIRERRDVAISLAFLTQEKLDSWPVARRLGCIGSSVILGEKFGLDPFERRFAAAGKIGDEGEVRRLLQEIEDPNRTITFRPTSDTEEVVWPIAHLLAFNGQPTALADWKAQHGDRVDFNAKDLRGNTPLHYAVAANSAKTVEWLLDQGVDIDSIGGEGASALLMAVERPGKRCVANLLIDRGADTKIADADGWVALHYAAAQKDMSLMEWLVRDPSDLEQADSDGTTPADLLASGLTSPTEESDSADGVKHSDRVLEKEWRVSSEDLGFTKAHVAAFVGDGSYLSEVLFGPDMEQKDAEGRFPLQLVCQLGHEELLKELVLQIMTKDPLLLAGFPGMDLKAFELFGKLLNEEGCHKRVLQLVSEKDCEKAFVSALGFRKSCALNPLFTPNELKKMVEEALKSGQEESRRDYSSFLTGHAALTAALKHGIPFLPETLLGVVRDQLEEWDTYEVMIAAATEECRRPLASLVGALGTDKQNLVVSLVGQELFIDIAARLGEEKLEPLLHLATSEQKIALLEKIEDNLLTEHNRVRGQGELLIERLREQTEDTSERLEVSEVKGVMERIRTQLSDYYQAILSHGDEEQPEIKAEADRLFKGYIEWAEEKIASLEVMEAST